MVELPFNLFDILLAVVLGAGMIHGRKYGLSRELLSSIKWMTLLIGCALIYHPAGSVVANAGFFNLLTCYLSAYLATALVIFLAFSILERRWAPKLEGSDVFGRGEYFLGMGSGMIRFGSILIVSLSLLNAREFTPAELKAMEQYEEDAYGSHIFPGLHSLQREVFEKSLTGPWIKEDMSFLLITPTGVNRKSPKS